MRKQNGRSPLERALGLALGSSLVLSMAPTAGVQVALATSDSEDATIHYLDASQSERTVKSSNWVTSETTKMGNGWYVVDKSVVVGDRITISGTVNLILCDGATLTASQGISTTGATLNIYAGASPTASSNKILGTGALSASSDTFGVAAIGGGSGDAGGTITINGGTVTASGLYGAGAGIGGGTNGAGGTITINGGTVTASSSFGSAAAIGGGNHGVGATVTINGGTVTATTLSGGGAGIGGGSDAAGGAVTINGGTVSAQGAPGASGIGAGLGGSSEGTLTVGSGLLLLGGSEQNDMRFIQKVDGDYSRYRYMSAKNGVYTEYPLWIGGTRVTSLNCNDLEKNGWSFTPAEDGKSARLILSNYNNNGRVYSYDLFGQEEKSYHTIASYAAIYYCFNDENPLVIELRGNNNLSKQTKGSSNGDGIYSHSALIIEGDGSLTVDASYSGIETPRGMLIKSGTLKVNGDGSAGLDAQYGNITIGEDGSDKSPHVSATGKRGGIIATLLKANKGTVYSEGNIRGVSSKTSNDEVIIGSGITSFVAAGPYGALSYGQILRTDVAGKAWTDVQGTKDLSTIVPSQNVPNIENYKKVEFISHDFTYSASGATITATCKADVCDLAGKKASLTIAAPACKTYGDGQSTSATVTGDTDVLGTPKITYAKGNETLSGEPSDAGTYTASITLGEGKNAKTAKVTYTIAQRPITIKANDQTIDEDQEIAKGTTRVKVSKGSLLSNHSIKAVELTGDKSTGSINPSSARIFDGGIDVTRNYAITYEAGRLTVMKKDPAVTAPVPVERLTYTGSAQELVHAGATSGGTLEYALGESATQQPDLSPTRAVWTQNIPTATNAGTYYVWYRVLGDSGHNNVAAACVPVTIAKADPIANVPTGLTAAKNQTLVSVPLTNPEGNTPGTWAWEDSSQLLSDAGINTFKATFTPNDTSNYNSKSGIGLRVDVTSVDPLPVSPSDPTVTNPTKKGSLTFTGSAQELINAGTVEGGTMWYALGSGNGQVPTSGWSTDIPTATNAGEYDVWFMVEGDAGHKDVDPLYMTVSIAQAEPVAKAPAGLTATYGQRLSELKLANPADNTPGTWTWEDEGAAVGNAGERTHKARFTPADATNYKAVAGADVAVTVNKAAATLPVFEPYNGIYDGKEHQLLTLVSPHDGGTMLYYVGDEDEYTDDKVVYDIPTEKNAGTYHVWYAVLGDENHYDSEIMLLSSTIAAAAATANAPSATATYGQTLADVKLTNPAGNTPGTWSWEDGGATSVGAVGTNTFKATFTPDDKSMLPVRGVDVKVSVGKASFGNKTVSGAVKAGTKGTIDLSSLLVDGYTAKVTSTSSKFSDVSVSDNKTLDLTAKSGEEGTEDVVVEVSSANYEDYTITATVEVTDKDIQTITANDVTTTYGMRGAKVEATTTQDGGALSYKVKSGDAVSVNAQTGELTIAHAGTAVITVTAAENDKFEEATKDVTVTVEKAESTLPTLKANNITYDGKSHGLVTLEGAAEGGTMLYYVGDAEDYADEKVVYEVPEAKEVGIYPVWYALMGDENHKDSEIMLVTSSITQNEGGDIPSSEVDKAKLQEAVDAFAAVDLAKYTEESAKAYQDAVDAGKVVLADASATQEQVDAATEAINAAAAALVEKGTTPEIETDGWKHLGGETWVYLRSGERVTGWLFLPGTSEWFWFDADGVMASGWREIDGQWYFFQNQHDGHFGRMISGWLWDNGFWYLLNQAHNGSFGAMLTGWQWDGLGWYYLRPQAGGPKGSCVMGGLTPDGYRVEPGGRWIG